MPTNIHPTPEMVKDLQEVFAKHNWSGQPIGLVQPNALAENAAAGGDPDNCAPGKIPQTVSYRLPNGDVITKTICV